MNKRIITLFILCLTVCSSCKNKEETVSKTQYETQYDHLWQMWNRSLDGKDFDVAFYGDSRVAGGDFEKKYEDKNAINLGIGGDKISHCIRRFEMIKTTKPEIVFLAVGGNNLKSSGFDISYFEEQYVELLNLFKTVETRLILHTIPGITTSKYIDEEKASVSNECLVNCNQVISRLADEGKYTIIDLAQKMNNQDGSLNKIYTTDGVHFNKLGYEIWFKEIDSILA